MQHIKVHNLGSYSIVTALPFKDKVLFATVFVIGSVADGVTDMYKAKSSATFVMMCMFAGLLMTSCASGSAKQLKQADGEDHSRRPIQMAAAYILEEVLIQPQSTGKALHDNGDHLMAFEHEVQHLLSAGPIMNWAQVMQRRGQGGRGFPRGLICRAVRVHCADQPSRPV